MTSDKDWWKSAVIYQIYPRSFKDSNDDGVGDLRGIIEKLDYIKDLGVDAIWINPFFKSPMKDFGYDVSDYLEVDPIFGKNTDLIELITQVHIRNLKIILDLPLNHTSNEHPWFLESSSSLDNPKRDWYIWQKATPNNWKNVYNASAWELNPKTNEYYYHFFLPDQPDLNLRNPEVRVELEKIIKFYLDLGVDGFRLDSVNTFLEDTELRDNPEGLIFEQNNFSNFKYNFDQPENVDFIVQIRKLLDQYSNKVLIGEVNPNGPIQDGWINYFGDVNPALDLIYNFDLLYKDLTFELLQNSIINQQKIPVQNWPTFALGSHDQPRFASRLTVDDVDKNDKIKLLSTFLLTTHGTPFIYYGEELGLPEIQIDKASTKDLFAILSQTDSHTRDGCRTPMLWDVTDQAGFTKSPNPWLPIHSNYAELCVESQTEDKNSILNHYKNLLVLRKKYPALQLGEINVENTNQAILHYHRKYKEQTVSVLLNFSDQEVELPNHNVILQSNLVVKNIVKSLGFVIYL